MEKAKFSYTKEDGSTSERIILKPSFLKEATNSLKNLDNENVKYIKGYEIDKSGLNESDIREYEEAIQEYYEINKKSLVEFISHVGLDPKKIQEKCFKKQGVKDFEILS